MLDYTNGQFQGRRLAGRRRLLLQSVRILHRTILLRLLGGHALFNFVFADKLFILHDYTLTQFPPKLIPFLYFDIFFFRCAHYSQSAFLFITCFIFISSFGYWILQSPPLYNTNDYILQSETSLSYIRFNWSGPSSY